MVTAKKVRYIAIVNSGPRPMAQILITEEIISNIVNPNDNKKNLFTGLTSRDEKEQQTSRA